METKRIYFVRHGETQANVEEYCTGSDEPLNEKGLLQADAMAQRLMSIEFKKLIVSDFKRAKQTAEPITKLKGMSAEEISFFHEVVHPSSLFGVHDSDERIKVYRQTRNENVENPSWAFEDGETLPSVFKRIQDAREYLENESSESIVVVSHAFFLGLFTAAILLDELVPTKQWFSLAKKLRMSNTGVSLFEIIDGQWRLIMWNDHAHFAE